MHVQILQPLVFGANLDRHVRGSKGVTGTIMECSIVIRAQGTGKKITGLVLGPVRVIAQISVRFANQQVLGPNLFLACQLDRHNLASLRNEFNYADKEKNLCLPQVMYNPAS